MTRPFTGKTGYNVLPLSHSATGHSGPQHPYDDNDALGPPREVIASCYNPPKGATGGPPGSWRVPTDYFRWSWRTEDKELTGDVYRSSFGSPYTFSYTATTHTGNRGFGPGTYVSSHGLSQAKAGFLHSEVRIKARNRMKEENVNLAEIFSDAPQTARQLATIVKSGYNLTETYLSARNKLVTLAKKSPKSYYATVIKEASNLWLGYQYGIRPLINDAYSVAELLRQQLNGSKDTPLLITTARTSFDDEVPIGWRSEDGGIRVESGVTRIKYKAEAKYFAAIPNSWYYQADRFGIVNPYLIVWNATGLSFVIDWFYSVASWLESLSAPVGLNIIGGYSCIRLDVSEDAEWHMFDRSWYRHYLDNGSTTNVKTEFSAIERWSDNSGSGIVLPYLKSPFRTKNVISAAALLVQRRRASTMTQL